MARTGNGCVALRRAASLKWVAMPPATADDYSRHLNVNILQTKFRDFEQVLFVIKVIPCRNTDIGAPSKYFGDNCGDILSATIASQQV